MDSEHTERFRAAVERAVLEQLEDGDCGLRGWLDDEPCEGGLCVWSSPGSGFVCGVQESEPFVFDDDGRRVRLRVAVLVEDAE